MSKEIFLDAPNVGLLEKKYINRAIDEGFVSTVGPFVSAFEERFEDYLGVKKAVSTQSGTTAIHIALYELGIGKGDEVIIPALTFVATANPVMYVGAIPVFADVDLNSWNIEPSEIEKNITKKTKAIMPVHFYGNPCDMDRINKIARKHGIYVIEDATESLGAKYKRRHTGTFGDLGCFSFNGNKIVTTGGGGMVVGNNVKHLEHIKFLVNQAREGSSAYYHSEIGFNYRMTNIEAALGIAQMEKLGYFLEKKRRINQIYREELESLDLIDFQESDDEAESSWWLTCIIFKEKTNIPALQSKLKQEGIPTRRIFSPLLEFPPYKQYGKDRYKNSYHVYERGLCLPSSTRNSEQGIRHVCKMLKKAV